MGGRLFQVVIVAGFHLFPFRTEKLSPPAPMVLHTRGRVGSRRFLKKPFESNLGGLFLLHGGQGRDRQGGDRRRTAGHGGFLIREEPLRRKMWGLYLYIRNKKRTFAAEIEKSIRNLRVREHTKRPSGINSNT